jgi:hypothetical protein
MVRAESGWAALAAGDSVLGWYLRLASRLVARLASVALLAVALRELMVLRPRLALVLVLVPVLVRLLAGFPRRRALGLELGWWLRMVRRSWWWVG